MQAPRYSGTWELGTPKGLSRSVLHSEVVLFVRSISMYRVDLGTEVVVLNSQVVPVSQVVVKTGFTVVGKRAKKDVKSSVLYSIAFLYILLQQRLRKQ